MMLPRNRIHEKIHDYVAGDLSREEAADIERRIAADPRLRALYDRARDAHEALGTLKDRPAAPLGADDALPKIRAALAASRFRPRVELSLQSEGTRLYRRLAVAALFLCGLSFSMLAWNRFAPAPDDGAPSPAPLPLAREARTPFPEDGVESFVRMGVREIDAAEWLEMVQRAGLSPDEVVFTPRDTVLPVALPAGGR